MVGKSKPASKTEKARMQLIKEQAWCIPCILNGTPNRPATTIQHVVDGQKRTGDSYGCCGWHHLGVQEGELPRQVMLHDLGPSLALTKRFYREIWGKEDILVELQDFLIEMWKKQPWDQYNLPRYVGNELRKRWQQLRGLR